MSTFFIYGLDPSPGAIADDKGNVVVFKKVVDMYWLERFARHVAVDMGAGAGFATDADDGRLSSRRSPCPDTLTQALDIGRTILDARAKRQDVVARLLDATGATLFFTGKVAGRAARIEGRLRDGRGRADRRRRPCGRQARIAIQNENLVLFGRRTRRRRSCPISS